MFGFLAAASAGDISHGYVGYAAPTIHKTIEYAAPTVAKTFEYAAPVAKAIEYAAPVTKTIYQPSPVYAKSVYEPEYNYHAYSPSAYAQPAYAHAQPAYSHGTLSHYGKTIATPHSYVNKYDTRYISDDAHYKVAYPAAYPTVVKSAYPTVVKSIAPVVPTVVKSPIVPTVVKSYDAYDHSYGHGSYAHATPVIAKAAVSYSPAVAVSHATFESAHGHYAW